MEGDNGGGTGIFACEHLQYVTEAGPEAEMILADECLEGRAHYCRNCGVVYCGECYTDHAHPCKARRRE